MCRQLCSKTYDLTCSGFLYNRRLQKCELTPYTGEWVTTAGLSFDSSSGLEFYRRRRCLGQIRISSVYSIYNLLTELKISTFNSFYLELWQDLVSC